MDGELTIGEITRPLTLDVEFGGVAEFFDGTRHASFEANGEISRKEFGLTWNQALETGGVLIGDKIDIELDLELTKATAETAEDA